MAEAPLKPRPADASMWDDRDLRPWTIDEELDKKIAEENDRLQDCVQKTSGSKIAGARGMNDRLDAKPDMFLDFERFLSDPSWLYKLGSADMDAEEERQFQELVVAAQAAIKAEQESQIPETNNPALVNPDDKLLLNSILEFNQALYDRGGSRAGSRQGRPVAAAAQAARDAFQAKAEAFQQFIDLRGIATKKKKKKKVANPAYSLKAIKYEGRKNPAVMNVSTVEFQQLLERFNMTMSRSPGGRGGLNPSASAPALLQGVTTTGELRGSGGLGMMLNNAATGLAGSGGDAAAEAAQRTKDMNALSQFLSQSLGPGADAAPVAALSPQNHNVATVAPSLKAVPENSELDAIFNLKDNDLLRPASKNGADASSLSPAQRPESSPVRAASASFLLRGTEFSAEERALLEAARAGSEVLAGAGDGPPTSPIQCIAPGRPGSRLGPTSTARLEPISAPTSPAKPQPQPQPQPQTGLLTSSASTSSLVLPTPRTTTMRPATNSSHSVSEARTAARLSTPSQALNKLGISSTMGTVQLGNSSPGTLGKARIKAMRTLRDQLMSTSGSLAMNVHPEASPDAQSDAKESVRVTQEMVKETIEKNRVDQTWTLLSTPGYYEAVGPDQIFKSDTSLGFLVDDKFDKAVRAFAIMNPVSFRDNSQTCSFSLTPNHFLSSRCSDQKRRRDSGH